MSWLFLVGCGVIGDTRDALDRLGEERLGLGLVLDAVPPDDPVLAEMLAASDLAGEVAASVVLADAGDIEALDDAAITGSVVELTDGTGRTGVLAEPAPGTYALEPGSGLIYRPGDLWFLSASDGVAGEVVLPDSADVSAAVAAFEPGRPLVLPVPDGFDRLLVVVLDAQGEITWSNLPEDARGIFDLLLGAAPEVVEVPAEAFPDPLHALGVTGVRYGDRSTLAGLNPLVSRIGAGRMVVHPLGAVPELP